MALLGAHSTDLGCDSTIFQMKNIVLYFIIVASFISCKKEDDHNNRWGTASALKNGENWEGEISTAHNIFIEDSGRTIQISSVNQAGFDEDYLAFFKVPLIIDKHPISLTAASLKDSLIGAYYNTLLSDGHVFGDIYYVLEDDPVEDYIEITDISGDEIKGRFQVSFLRDTTSIPVSSSTLDTIIFTNGQFHTRFRN